MGAGEGSEGGAIVRLVAAGEHVKQVIRDAKKIALERRAVVGFIFNDIVFRISGDSDQQMIYRDYCRAFYGLPKAPSEIGPEPQYFDLSDRMRDEEFLKASGLWYVLFGQMQEVAQQAAIELAVHYKTVSPGEYLNVYKGWEVVSVIPKDYRFPIIVKITDFLGREVRAYATLQTGDSPNIQRSVANQ